jgi:soluble lytic murein transglycosylase
VESAARRRAPRGRPFDGWLLAALARRESRFWSRAASPAGAVGLMQLTPDTAARIAREVGREPPGRSGLFDPVVNVDLGAAYLAALVEEFGGEWAPALASYNAGEAVVRGWWAARPAGQEIDEWIETIPYVETRLYVKSILGDYASYRELYPPVTVAAR